MILVYTTEITPRVDYAFRLIFETILGFKVVFTSQKQEFIHYNDAKINYSTTNLNNGLFLAPHPLLFTNDIHISQPSVANWKDNVFFFKSSGDSFFPYDIFSASFFLVTRIEEYNSGQKDAHGRFLAEASLAYQYHFLKKPVIDHWAYLLVEEIQKHYPEFPSPQRKFNHLQTFDIDNAFAYKNRSFFRHAGAVTKAVFRLDLKSIIDRAKVCLGNMHDPYDTFDYIKSKIQHPGVRSCVFFPTNNASPNDRNISHQHPAFNQLVSGFSRISDIGIHPSYKRGNTIEGLQKEITRLSIIPGKKITKSRHHYLRMSIPETYRLLIELGIQEDYTMGYGSHSGFRAGTCTPFQFFDLGQNKKTGLTIFPLPIMDVTLKNYLGLSPDQARQEIRKIIGEIKCVNGTFVSLWHNESLSEYRKWKNWRTVFEFMLEEVQNIPE